MTRATTRLAWLFALAMGLTPLAARADTPAETPRDPRGTEMKAHGDEAMLALRYDEALAAYRAAYAISNDPALLYNQARALQALGDYGLALDFYERFDTEAPVPLKARVPRLPALIDEARARVAVLDLRCNVAGAQVMVNDRIVATTPLAKPMRVTATRATIRVSAEGYRPFTKQVDLPARGALAIDVELIPKDVSGVVVVTSNILHARLALDGKPVGDVPAEVALKAGNHVARIESAGYEPATRPFVLDIGEKKALHVVLATEPPITAKWWFWAGIGAVGVAAATTAIVLTRERAPGDGTISPGRVSGPLVAF